tara:strand:+ start:4599 stop:5657 length:1059 start_codon:yes stop_codon:yes gene_type:complete
MHKLLARQIRKFLTDDLAQLPAFRSFFESVGKSYVDYESKLDMLQRSTVLSSIELSEANDNLLKRADAQTKIIESLERSIAALSNNKELSVNDGNGKNKQIDLLELAKTLETQAREINRISSEKDLLLLNLEDQNEALNNYAHMVSHDLKSPIRNVSFLMDCVHEEEAAKFSENSLKNCALVAENLEKMDALIDGILQHATIITNEDKNVDIDIKTLIQDILFSVYVPENVQVKVVGSFPNLFMDKYKLDLLFKNLILNAISATEHMAKGNIEIEALQMPEHWQFCIRDNGKGIPLKHQENIFQMFKKLENNFKATGIGLALVKKIVNYFEGEIWLESVVEQGTEFYFTIKK